MSGRSFWAIQQELEYILNSVSVDTETGEVVNDIDWEAIERLGIERSEKIDGVLTYIKSQQAYIDGWANDIKQATERMRKRQAHVDALTERLKQFLNGEKFENEHHQVTYRKSSSVEFTNEQEAVNWLINNGHEECLKLPDQTIHVNKASVKSVLKTADVPGVRQVENLNIQIK